MPLSFGRISLGRDAKIEIVFWFLRKIYPIEKEADRMWGLLAKKTIGRPDNFIGRRLNLMENKERERVN